MPWPLRSTVQFCPRSAARVFTQPPHTQRAPRARAAQSCPVAAGGDKRWRGGRSRLRPAPTPPRRLHPATRRCAAAPGRAQEPTLGTRALPRPRRSRPGSLSARHELLGSWCGRAGSRRAFPAHASRASGSADARPRSPPRRARRTSPPARLTSPACRPATATRRRSSSRRSRPSTRPRQPTPTPRPSSPPPMRPRPPPPTAATAATAAATTAARGWRTRW